MADETTTSTEDETTTAADEETTTDAELLAGAKNQDAVKNALKSEREAAKTARKEAEQLAAKVKEYEDKDKSDQQKLEEAAKVAESKASEATLKALRYEVAAEKELPLKWAARLSGNTKEELLADATELAKELKTGSRTSMDGGARQPAPTSAGMDTLIRERAGRL